MDLFQVISETITTQRGQRQPFLVCTNLLVDQSSLERTILSLVIRELISNGGMRSKFAGK